MTAQDDNSARGASLPPIDVPALLGRFREGYGIGQLSAWCGHGQGAIEDVLREALRGQMREALRGQMREAFMACIAASCDQCARGVEIDKDGGSRNWLHWEGKGSYACSADHLWRLLASRQPAPPAARETGAP